MTETPGYGPRTGDAYGELLLATFPLLRAGTGQETAPPAGAAGPDETVERDDGVLMHTPAARYFEPPERSPELSAALDLVHGRVLDIGAGAGRCAVPLRARGHAVTALDTSPGAIEICRRRGLTTLFHGTVAEHAATGARYDTLLLYGNNLGLLAGPDQAPGMLDALTALAAPGARVVAQGLDPYRTSNELHLRYHQRNRARGRWGGQVGIRVRYLDLATPWFDYLFCSVEELERLLAGSGWRLADVLPGQEGRYLVTLLR